MHNLYQMYHLYNMHYIHYTIDILQVPVPLYHNNALELVIWLFPSQWPHLSQSPPNSCLSSVLAVCIHRRLNPLCSGKFKTLDTHLPCHPVLPQFLLSPPHHHRHYALLFSTHSKAQPSRFLQPFSCCVNGYITPSRN